MCDVAGFSERMVVLKKKKSTFLRNKLVMKLASSPRFYVSITRRPHCDLMLLLEKDWFRDNRPIVRYK